MQAELLQYLLGMREKYFELVSRFFWLYKPDQLHFIELMLPNQTLGIFTIGTSF